MLEEAPSPALNDELRKKMGDAAVKAAQAVKYKGVGTIEFLLDSNGEFYFMEMNTRVQVEHPVTEMVTGIDIIKKQIKIAAGENLNMKQEDVEIRGVAIECRINAEDPRNNFIPSPGTIEELNIPGGFGVRVDTHIYQGYKISPYYDSLIAKLVVVGHDRREAIGRMNRALEEFYISPTKTTIGLHIDILKDPRFLKGKVTTHFLDKMIRGDTEG